MFILLWSTLFFGFLSSTETDCCISKSFFDFGALLFFIGVMVIVNLGVFFKWNTEPGPMESHQWHLTDISLWIAATGILCLGISKWLLLF